MFFQERNLNQKWKFEKTRLFGVFLTKRKPLFKTNIHDPQKNIFRPKCRSPTIVQNQKSPRNLFQFSVKESILKIEKKKFCLNFFLFNVNKSCWDEAKIFLKLVSKTKLASNKYEKKNFCQLIFSWKYCDLKLAKKSKKNVLNQIFRW